MRTKRLGLLAITLAMTGCFQESPNGDTLTIADTPPPPIFGGGLLVSRDISSIVVADPDHDTIWIADSQLENAQTVPLAGKEWPFRIAEGADNEFYVTLRRSASVVKIANAGNGFVEAERFEACSNPRGIAVHNDKIFVGCLAGEVREFEMDGTLVRTHDIGRSDVRDIVVTDDNVFASIFRESKIVKVSRVEESAPQLVEFATSTTAQPNTAWKMVAHDDGVAVVHQMTDPTVPLQGRSFNGVPVYYGSGSRTSCTGAAVEAAITYVTAAGIPSTGVVGDGALPVDISKVGGEFLIATAGEINQFDEGRGALRPAPEVGVSMRCDDLADSKAKDGRQVTAVGDIGDRWVAFSRDPFLIYTAEKTLTLDAEDRKDSGHDLFHEDAGQGIACASCHAEGGDDSLTWEFTFGPRRTPDMRGGILETAPFHWSGDIDNFDHLSEEVFTGRMGGALVPPIWADAMANWIDTIPMPVINSDLDMDRAARGKEIFESDEVGCNDCHNGNALTNSETVDVGTGEPLQVPPLRGIEHRAPFMHDGCAATLKDRFDTSCGGTDHGDTSMLSDDDLDDLIEYLKTL